MMTPKPSRANLSRSSSANENRVVQIAIRRIYAKRIVSRSGNARIRWQAVPSADDLPCLGLDLDRPGHAGGEVDGAAVDVHLRVVKRDAGGVDEFFAFRLAWGGVRNSRPSSA
jgi:hypothetical protein